MKELSLEEIKNIELDILIEFDSICKKNNIKYSLIGGTLLGAVRHKGFIPWDDDIDVVLLREEYDKLINYYKNNKTKYVLINNDINKKYNVMFSKIYYDKTFSKRNNKNVFSQNFGVYIDVFPVDKIGDNLDIIYKKLKTKDFYRTLLYFKNYLLFSDVSSFIQTSKIKEFLFFIFSRLLSSKFIIKRIFRLFNEYKNKNTDYVACLCGMYGRKEILKKNIFDDFIDIEFENYTFSIIKNYDLWLSQMYGDYMTLPPIEKQISNHDYNFYLKD